MELIIRRCSKVWWGPRSIAAPFLILFCKHSFHAPVPLARAIWIQTLNPIIWTHLCCLSDLLNIALQDHAHQAVADLNFMKQGNHVPVVVSDSTLRSLNLAALAEKRAKPWTLTFTMARTPFATAGLIALSEVSFWHSIHCWLRSLQSCLVIIGTERQWQGHKFAWLAADLSLTASLCDKHGLPYAVALGMCRHWWGLQGLTFVFCQL